MKQANSFGRTPENSIFIFMQCCVCKEKPATVHLTQIVGDKMQKLDMCDECAKAKGINDPASFAMADLMLGLGASQELDPSAAGESFVAIRAAEPSGLLEIRLRKSAARTLQLRARRRLIEFLRGAEAEHEIRHREARRVIDALGLRALIAHIQLLHLVAHDLGQMHRRRFFFAHAALHKILFANRRMIEALNRRKN